MPHPPPLSSLLLSSSPPSPPTPPPLTSFSCHSSSLSRSLLPPPPSSLLLPPPSSLLPPPPSSLLPPPPPPSSSLLPPLSPCRRTTQQQQQHPTSMPLLHPLSLHLLSPSHLFYPPWQPCNPLKPNNFSYFHFPFLVAIFTFPFPPPTISPTMMIRQLAMRSKPLTRAVMPMRTFVTRSRPTLGGDGKAVFSPFPPFEAFHFTFTAQSYLNPELLLFVLLQATTTTLLSKETSTLVPSVSNCRAHVVPDSFSLPVASFFSVQFPFSPSLWLAVWALWFLLTPSRPRSSRESWSKPLHVFKALKFENQNKRTPPMNK